MDQSIGRTGTAIRNRARSATVHQTGGTLFSFKDGNLFLHNVDVETSVNTGEKWNLSFTVSNGALAILFTDPDSCGGADELNGYKYEVWVNPSWVTTTRGPPWRSGEVCLKTAAVGTNDRDHSVQFIAPTSPGTYYVNLHMRLLGSGESASINWTIDVSESEPDPECTSDADCGPGQVCENETCVEDEPDPECTFDADCGFGQVCENGTCVDDQIEPECTSDADCGSGQVCENGTCVQEQTQPLQIESVEVIPVTTDSLGTLQDGDTAAVRVTWTNPNNSFVDFTKDVQVNGNRIGSFDQATLPGQTQSGEIEFTVGGPGTYTVSVGAESASVEIGGDTNGNGDDDECTSDTDCIGQLVCEGGQCVQPPDGDGGLSTTTLAVIGGAGALGVLAVAMAGGGNGSARRRTRR